MVDLTFSTVIKSFLSFLEHSVEAKWKKVRLAVVYPH
jgi:hypothetical protein